MASTLACRMLRRSISCTDAAPIPIPTAFARILPMTLSRFFSESCFESLIPGIARRSCGITTAHATTGPARGPRPTSSTPAISGPCCKRRSRSIVLQRMAAVRGSGGLVFRGPCSRHDDSHLLFLDARCLAGELAQVVQLRPAHATATHHLNVADHWAVHGKDALDANTVRNLADCERLADTTAAAGDAHAFERLNALLVTFLHAHIDAQRVARTEGRQIAPQPGFLSLDEGVHSLLRGWPEDKRRYSRARAN